MDRSEHSQAAECSSHQGSPAPASQPLPELRQPPHQLPTARCSPSTSVESNAAALLPMQLEWPSLFVAPHSAPATDLKDLRKRSTSRRLLHRPAITTLDADVR